MCLFATKKSAKWSNRIQLVIDQQNSIVMAYLHFKQSIHCYSLSTSLSLPLSSVTLKSDETTKWKVIESIRYEGILPIDSAFLSVDFDAKNTDPFLLLTRSKQVRLLFDVARRYPSVQDEHLWMVVRLRFLMYQEEMHHSFRDENVEAIGWEFHDQHFSQTYKRSINSEHESENDRRTFERFLRISYDWVFEDRSICSPIFPLISSV